MEEEEANAIKKLDEYDFSTELTNLCRDGRTDVYDVIDELITRHPELEDIFDLFDTPTVADYFKEKYTGFFIQQLTSYHIQKYHDSIIQKKI